MKNIRGGVAMGQGSCSFFGSCNNFPTLNYDPDNTVQATISQIMADEFCEGAGKNCCSDVDCPGAV
jgi:hypothetical protein